MSKNAVVIVAAGRGERLGNTGNPKQYRMIGRFSVLQHTVNCFLTHPDIDVIQVVIHRDDYKLYADCIESSVKLFSPISGGSTRQTSCRIGIEAMCAAGCEKVLIHDAARPFVSKAVISHVLTAIRPGIGVLPAIAVADSLKSVDIDRHVQEDVSRSGLYLAQTPQGFVAEEICGAHIQVAGKGGENFTDDAALARWAGMPIKIVEGDRNNFKITTTNDLEAAREIVEMRHVFADVRTASGYDVHPLVPGDGVILCGVKIPHDMRLEGHSDADVGLHALTDALLGTIGAGDIGLHFPPTDECWKGAESGQFLKHAADLVRGQGGIITCLDATIICEEPKIGPYRQAMRESVSNLCNVELERISLKATTNERIGFIGRKEGIATLATASVSFSTIKSSERGHV